jgi:hypothetical protein
MPLLRFEVKVFLRIAKAQVLLRFITIGYPRVFKPVLHFALGAPWEPRGTRGILQRRVAGISPPRRLMASSNV